MIECRTQSAPPHIRTPYNDGIFILVCKHIYYNGSTVVRTTFTANNDFCLWIEGCIFFGTLFGNFYAGCVLCCHRCCRRRRASPCLPALFRRYFCESVKEFYSRITLSYYFSAST